MARWLVEHKSLSIRLACNSFAVNEGCYRYSAKPSTENYEIADWLLRLTQHQRNWGGLVYAF